MPIQSTKLRLFTKYPAWLLLPSPNHCTSSCGRWMVMLCYFKTRPSTQTQLERKTEFPNDDTTHNNFFSFIFRKRFEISELSIRKPKFVATFDVAFDICACSQLLVCLFVFILLLCLYRRGRACVRAFSWPNKHSLKWVNQANERKQSKVFWWEWASQKKEQTHSIGAQFFIYDFRLVAAASSQFWHRHWEQQQWAREKNVQ